MSAFCIDCDSLLTSEEAEYYECRCERCERLEHERIEAWRLGKRHDPELDRMYSAHIESADCWCSPTLEYADDTARVWVHHQPN